jgi:multisubunit Na+/H+ antiporter MnhG subunit
LEYFLEHQKIIFRTLGAIMLMIGFVVHFWFVPHISVSKNEIAAANVARMEASVASKSVKKAKPSVGSIVKALKATKAKQMEYLTLFAMIFGVLFLAYSFLKREES